MAWKQTVNKPAAKSAVPKPKFDTKDDDWDTDISYENNSTEKSQRYGSKSVPGSGRVDHVDLGTIQEKMKTVDQVVKQDFKEKHPTRGYGGKYGTEQVMDKAAEDFSYKADVKKHSSQTDGKKGFGGEHGIDERAKDQSAVGFDYKPTVEKHSSQTDYTAGFGAKQEAQAEELKTPPVTTSAALPPTPPPKPAPKPSVVAKPVTPTETKAGVGNIRARFENIKKQQEDETAERVAEERKKRATTDQKLQQQQSNDNAQEEVEKQETPPATKETTREPSPVRSQPEVLTEPTSETVENTNTEPVGSTENPDDNDDKTETSTTIETSTTNETLSKNDEDESVENKDDANQ